jgi:hypothetical protein
MNKSLTLALALAAFSSMPVASSAIAADDCIVHYIRTACPGKEAESYSKCGGSKSCDKNEDASTEAACVAAAKAACPNGRLDITKSKRITARFNGKSLKGPYGGSFCAPNRPDFNKCKS